MRALLCTMVTLSLTLSCAYPTGPKTPDELFNRATSDHHSETSAVFAQYDQADALVPESSLLQVRAVDSGPQVAGVIGGLVG